MAHTAMQDKVVWAYYLPRTHIDVYEQVIRCPDCGRIQGRARGSVCRTGENLRAAGIDFSSSEAMWQLCRTKTLEREVEMRTYMTWSISNRCKDRAEDKKLFVCDYECSNITQLLNEGKGAIIAIGRRAVIEARDEGLVYSFSLIRPAGCKDSPGQKTLEAHYLEVIHDALMEKYGVESVLTERPDSVK